MPAGVSGSPQTIEDVVALANALFAERPESLSLDCLLERLQRPLAIMGVLSDASLQPAVGEQSPRIFIFTGGLVMSVVPAGEGSPLLELAQYTSSAQTQSIKAQMVFPLTAPMTSTYPFDNIHADGGSGTICGGCHTHEERVPQVTFAQAFESDVLQPLPKQVVPLDYMAGQASSCAPAQEPDRCAMLSALFDNGQVVSGAFAPDADTVLSANAASSGTDASVDAQGGEVGSSGSDTGGTEGGASQDITLTVLNYQGGCSVSINGGQASTAPDLIASVAQGSTVTLVAQPASASTAIGPDPWFGVTEDDGGAAPGVDDAANQTTSASVVVLPNDNTVTSTACVSVCCGSAPGGTGCPTTDPCLP